MNSLRLLLLCGAAALVAGCASMSESECRRADWLGRGLADGRAGEPMSQLDDHAKACAKAGVVPDAQRWQQGWTAGVAEYCRPGSAWRAGAAGKTYQGVCQAHDEYSFRRFYEAGREVYRARMDMERIGRDVNRAEEDLRKAKTEEERRTLRERIQSMDRERARIRRSIDAMERTAPPL